MKKFFKNYTLGEKLLLVLILVLALTIAYKAMTKKPDEVSQRNPLCDIFKCKKPGVLV